jgi:hypothetical protein
MVIGIILGAFIWLLFELNKALQKSDFNTSKFILLNWLPLLTNLVCGLTILWFKEDIQEYFIFNKVSSVILGMSGQAIFKKIVGIFDRNIETKIGLNKAN